MAYSATWNEQRPSEDPELQSFREELKRKKIQNNNVFPFS